MAREMLQILLKIKKCRLKKNTLSNQEIFPKSTYFMPNSKKLFRIIAEGTLEKVVDLVQAEPNLVYQLDTVI